MFTGNTAALFLPGGIGDHQVVGLSGLESTQISQDKVWIDPAEQRILEGQCMKLRLDFHGLNLPERTLQSKHNTHYSAAAAQFQYPQRAFPANIQNSRLQRSGGMGNSLGMHILKDVTVSQGQLYFADPAQLESSSILFRLRTAWAAIPGGTVIRYCCFWRASKTWCRVVFCMFLHFARKFRDTICFSG